MSKPTISVLIPTHGRMSIRTILSELSEQMAPTDEIIVVGDGPQPGTEAVCLEYPLVKYFEGPKTNVWGLAQLDVAQEKATGDFLAFVGDDDRLLPGAFEKMRERLGSMPVGPHLFSMKYETYYLGGDINVGTCSGQQIVVPNIPEKLAKWTWDDGENADWSYIVHTVENWHGEFFNDHDIAVFWLEKRRHGEPA